MMKRRAFLQNAGIGAGLALAGCKGQDAETELGSAAAARKISWKMVTSWPGNFPGLGTGAQKLADSIMRATNGELQIKVYASAELVPAFEVFDAVSRGTAQMGHSASYYWKSKSEAAPFFCTVPFGLNAQEMNGWLYHGGGLELWRALYAKFDLVPFPAGNTGVQTAGWFNREITGVRDLSGLKIRIPGLGGEVMASVGASPINLPGADIYAALQSGAIDAAEWVGPYNDLAFGLFRVAKYCYYPGWQEPGPNIECMINKTAFDGLPEDFRNIVEACCKAANMDMLAEYTAKNHQALDVLRREHHVEFRRLPDRVLTVLRQAAEKILQNMAGRDPFAKSVYDSQKNFIEKVRSWHAISEVPYYQARG